MIGPWALLLPSFVSYVLDLCWLQPWQTPCSCRCVLFSLLSGSSWLAAPSVRVTLLSHLANSYWLLSGHLCPVKSITGPFCRCITQLTVLCFVSPFLCQLDHSHLAVFCLCVSHLSAWHTGEAQGLLNEGSVQSRVFISCENAGR